MSVLPSFKSAFSSFAEVDISDGVRVADDSGFPRSQPGSATNSGPARHSPFQDHFPPRSQPPNPWSYLQSTTTPASTPLKEPATPDVIRQPLHTFRSRPAVPPLPLDQLSGEAPAFGFASRLAPDSTPGATAARSAFEPLPLEKLAFSGDVYDVRTESFKRTHSPSVHAGAYKRPRSQSVSAGVSSYVKLQSHSSSERRAKRLSPSPGRDLSVSASRQSPNDRLSSASGPRSGSPGSSRRDSVRVSGLLSSTALTRQTATKTYARPNSAGISLPRPVSVSREFSEVPNQYPRRGVASGTGSGSGSGGHDTHKRSSSSGASVGHRAPPSPSTLTPGNAGTNSSIPLPAAGKTVNLVSFASPSFSHRSGGSKGITHGYNTRILPEDDIIEDSTCRVPVDVLSSPRQRSLNSTLTGRTGPLRGALGQTLALSRGPTASDLSVLLGHTRHDRQDRDERSTGVDESDTGLPERQKQSMTTADSVVGSDGEQKGHKSESGDPMNLSTIVKNTTEGDTGRDYKRSVLKVGTSNVEVDSKERSAVLNGQTMDRNGSIQTGEATTTNLWGGQSADTDAGQWNGKGESSGERGLVEAWRQDPKPGVEKGEGKSGGLDENRNGKGRIGQSRLWAGETGNEEKGGSGSVGVGGHGGKDEDEYEKRNANGVMGLSRLWGGENADEEGGDRNRVGVYNGKEEWSDGEEQEAGNFVGEGEDKSKTVGLTEKGESGKAGAGSGEKSGEECESVQCPHCEKRLRNAVTLQNHVRVVHDHSGNFRCGQCGLTFMWRSTLGNHVRLVHEKQRPYDCKECSKAFRWKSHLREHIWVVHKGEKPFKCQTCGKKFGRKNNMQKHMRKHSEAGA